MANLTLQTKLPGVDSRFFVAVSTGAGRRLELLPGVAVLAGGFKMCPIQDKNQVMVKVAGFAAPLVALQAGRAEEVGVFGHKNSIGLGMTSLAIYRCDSVNGFFVAIVTGHLCAVKVGLVGDEAEAGETIMVELAEGHLGDLCLTSGVVGVAGLAALGIYEMTVQPFAALSLLGDGGMAIFTFSGGDALPSGVTEGALLLKCGVGSKTSEWGLARPRLSQMSRTKRPTTPPGQNRSQNDNKEYGSATAKAGEERVGALILHDET